MRHTIAVRPVREEDLRAIVALEEEAWSPLGTPKLEEEHFRAWYEQGSPFFLIAELDGRPCGYYVGELVDFRIEACGSFFGQSSGGPKWLPGSHAPGSSLFGINIVSTRRGAGSALYQVVRETCETLKVPYSVGISRLSGLDAYMQEHFGAEIFEPDEVALWYALGCGKLLGMRQWPQCARAPGLPIPPPRAPDPVLACHAKGGYFGILGVCRDYIVPDPQSRNFGVTIASAYPHRP